MPTTVERRQTEQAAGRGRKGVTEDGYRVGEEEGEVRRECMRVEKAPRGDIDLIRWAVDQRPFVWVDTSKPANAPTPGSPPPGTTWTDDSYEVTPLPYSRYGSGLSTTGGEAEFSKTLESSTPAPRDGKVLQAKVWEPELNGGQGTGPAMRSVFRIPPLITASSVDPLLSNSRITFMPVVRELTHILHPIDTLESTFKEGWSQKTLSLVEDMIEEDRVKNSATLKCKLSSTSSTYTGKASRNLRRSAGHSSRPCVPEREERATGSEDVSVFESLSDNDDLSYEDEVQIVSEKRRKRMLSNRASAQRSRQRRQQRLDTLEVLVAELRVENAALTRRANIAGSAAKKSEKENKVLRDRLGKLEPLSWSDLAIERDKTAENPYIAVNNIKNGGPARLYGGSVESMRNGSSSENGYHDRHSHDSSLPSKTNRDDDGAGAENSKPWNNDSSSTSFDVRFNSDPMEGVAPIFCGGRGGTLNRAARVAEGLHGKDLYRPATTNMMQPHSFQNIDAFSLELEQCNQDMDKKNLDSTSVEDIWLESLENLANCLK